MRITIPQPQFLKSLQTVEHAVNDRSTLPILANVLLETGENELVLTATDLDVGIRYQFPITQPLEQGAVALPARKLTTIVRELSGEEVVVVEAKKNHTATITCGSTSFRIPGLPPEDFPAFPPLQQSDSASLPQGALKTLITQTAHAMSVEETRFILNGMLLLAQKSELTVVATDGRRLAAASASLNKPIKHPLQAVIPSKTVRELSRLLQEEEPEDAEILPMKDNQITFRFGLTTLVTRLIEGQFPTYEKVIPPPSKNTVSCGRQALINAVRRVSLMTTATSQAVIFELNTNRLVVSKESAELGSAREELPVTYSGDAITVAFNPGFWLDVLKVLGSDEVVIEVTGPDRPAAIRQAGFVYIVLPMKVA